MNLKKKFIEVVFLSSNSGMTNHILTYKKFFLFMLYFFVICFIFGGIWGYNYYTYYTQNKNFALLQKELKRLQNSTDEFVSHTQRYIEKINLMVSSEQAKVSVNKKTKYGIGGGEEKPSENIKTEVDNKNLDSRGSKLNIFEKLDYLDNDLNMLIISLKNKKERLDSTPSIFPVEGIITSPYGYRTNPLTNRREFHRGIDILNDEGTPVISPADGEVILIDKNSLWGNKISIAHGYGIITEYGHLKEISASKGQKIKRGDLIGILGSTGRSTGPHLHYQIWINENVTNPLGYIIQDSF